MRTDLHLHSTFSDGEMAPMEMLRRAVAAGLEQVSITDHDNLHAYSAIDSHALPRTLRLVTGIELDVCLVNLGLGIRNVEILAYTELTVQFARKVGAKVILRGIRDTVDLHAELQIANTNLIIGDIETVFLMTSHEHVITSSSLITQIAQIGGYDRGSMARLVPLDVAERLEERLREKTDS